MGKKETTFLVEDLPEGMSSYKLWKLFETHGKVSDAYAAKKRNAGGRRFGFVRLLNIKNIEEKLENMKSVRYENSVLLVSLAKFDKQHRRIEHKAGGEHDHITENKTPRAWGPRGRREETLGQVKTNNAYSFRDALMQRKDGKERKSLKVDDNAESYLKHWVGKSLLGEVKSIKKLKLIRKIMADGGFEEVVTSYLGGMNILLSFRNKDLALEFKRTKHNFWSDFLS